MVKGLIEYVESSNTPMNTMAIEPDTRRAPTGLRCLLWLRVSDDYGLC
jgi:hypothetical protein